MNFEDPNNLDEINEYLMRNEIVNINQLNDDCLVNVFKYLPILDKLKIEAVCQRWHNLSKFSWSNLNLNFNSHFPDNNRISQASKNDVTKFIINILKKFGRYLNSLSIYYYLKVETRVLFELISKYCKNIRKIAIYDSPDDDKKFTDSSLELLFTSNPNICSISLSSINLKGSCFLSLNLEKIEELELKYCVINSIYLFGFLSHLKNLKKIRIYLENSEVEIIDALNLSKCESIREMDIRDKSIPAENLKKFLLRQTNLCKLTVWYIILNNEFIASLPVSIQKIYCGIIKKVPYSLCNLKNLNTLNCSIDNLTDEIINILTKCSNLEDITIEIEEYSLTSVGEYNFSKFENIKSIDIYFDGLENCVDNILIASSYCKTLKSLSFGYWPSLTIFGIMGMQPICDLRKFEVSNIKDNLENEALVILVKKFVNLRYINFCRGKNYLDNLEFFRLANKIKEKRKDKHVLEINLEFDEMHDDIEIAKYKKFNKNEFPLMKLQY